MGIKYAVIINQYIPETDTDLLLTRLEFVTSSYSEARRIQEYRMEDLKDTGRHYRSYIQERRMYTVPTGKKRNPERLTFDIVKVTDLMTI